MQMHFAIDTHYNKHHWLVESHIMIVLLGLIVLALCALQALLFVQSLQPGCFSPADQKQQLPCFELIISISRSS